MSCFLLTSKRKEVFVISDIWSSCLQIIRDEVGSRVVETWFKAVVLDTWNPGERVVSLRAPNTFVQEWISNNYLNLLQTHLGRLLNVERVRVTFINQPKKTSDTQSLHNVSPPVAVPVVVTNQFVKQKTKNTVVSSPLMRRGAHINRVYSFDTFVVGPSNSLSYAAAYAVTEKPGRLYNPLFMYGGSGLGKTHLLHAIGNAIKAKHKNKFPFSLHCR